MDTDETRPAGAEDGMTLVEVLIAMLVLGVSMLALTGVVVTSLQSQLNNERESVATATALELVERMQSVTWDAAAVYQADVTAGDANATRWRSRVDTTDWTFTDQDGTARRLIIEPGPATVADRDPRVPEPWFVETRQGVEFTVDVYPLWVGVEDPDENDHRRFVAVVSWEGRDGDLREFVVAGERAPTQGEATTTVSGYRAVQTFADPSTADLDEDGFLDEVVEVVVRFNRDVHLPSVTFSYLDIAADGGFTEEQDTVSMFPIAGESAAYRAVLSPSDGYGFRNGHNTMLVAGTNPDDGTEIITSTTSVNFVGGPYEQGPSPSPSPTTSPGPSPSPSPSPTPGYDDDVEITNKSEHNAVRICVTSSQWKLTEPIQVGVTVDGMTADNGSITVSIPYWTKKDKNTNPNAVAAVAAVDMTATTPNPVFPHDYMAQVGTSTELRFQPDDNISLVVEAVRDDGNSDVAVISNVQIRTNC